MAKKREPFYDDPGRLARFYSASVGDDTLGTPKGRQAAARGLADTYNVSEDEAARYLFYYFPNTEGRRGKHPRQPGIGSAKVRRPRQGNDPGTMSHQCSTCHRFYAGPDYGYHPRREMTKGPSGAEVSHGFCGPECQQKFMRGSGESRKQKYRSEKSNQEAIRERYKRSRGL